MDPSYGSGPNNYGYSAAEEYWWLNPVDPGAPTISDNPGAAMVDPFIFDEGMSWGNHPQPDMGAQGLQENIMMLHHHSDRLPLTPQSEIATPNIPALALLTSKQYEVFVEIQSKTASKSTKHRAKKDQAVLEGPITLDVPLSWAEFLECIGKGLDVSKDRLVVRSFKWKFQKPANSPFVTLHSEAAYVSMIRRISDRHEKMSVLTITMESPLKQSQSMKSQPWNDKEADKDEEDEVPLSRSSSRKGFENDLHETVAQIDIKYPVGICALHPEMQCFHHRPTNQHFELTKPRKLVWASSIKQGKADLKTIPLSSNLFQASQALKKVNSTPAAPSSLPSTPSTPTTSSGSNVPFMPHPYSMYGYPTPFFPQMAPFTPSPFMPWPNIPQPTAVGQNPPSSPPPADTGSVEDFYDQFKVAVDVREGLEKLGFQIGDDLSKVPLEDVKDVGIKLLDWQRVLKHYRKYKHQN